VHEGDDPDAFVDFLDADVLILTPSCPRDFSPWAASGFPMWRARETGEIQKALNIAPEASFALSIKNPEARVLPVQACPKPRKRTTRTSCRKSFAIAALRTKTFPGFTLPRMGTPIKPLFEGVWE